MKASHTSRRVSRHPGGPARLRRVLPLACALCLLLAAVLLTLGPRALANASLPPFVMDTTLPPQVVINADQGLGQCHWIDPNIISKSYVTWAYDAGPEASGWATIEPQPGVYSWTRMDGEVSKARTRGKRIWLEVHTTEGYTPRWAREAGVPLVGALQVPAPWDPTYQRLLRRVVHAMAARYDDNSTVDAIVVMAGGCYGEMTICNEHADEGAWVAAGYTDEKFATAVKQIVDIYLEDDYVWEDGTHTHGFRNTPVVLQVGTGLWEHAIVLDPVVGDIVRKYGSRVWLKYNGLGDGNLNLERIFREWDTTTRVGYEPVGNSVDFLNRPDYYVQWALNQHSSYLCLQDVYFNIYDETWQAAREMAARYLGAQIVHTGIEAPASVYPGQTYTFVNHWVNRGTVPLWYSQRRGIKGYPTSYNILLSFVNPSTGESVFDYSFVPTTPTTAWYSAQPVRIEQAIPIDAYVPAGEYDLRVALVRSGLDPSDPQRYFRLVNTALADGTGRYTVGRITVQNIGQTPLPTRTPTATPTRSPTLDPNVTPTFTPTRTATGVAATPTRTPTRTPTVVPPGGEVTVVLQQGLNDYAGAEDTFIHQYEPDRNTCRADALEVGWKQRYAALLRFDVSPVPAGSLVNQATLQVYASGWGGVDTALEVYRIWQPWRVCEATWNVAQVGTPWDQAGVNDIVMDRAPEPESSVNTDSIWKWYSFDVTALVQDWLNGSTGNSGVLLRGASIRSEGKFYFSSSEGQTVAYRPKLLIAYRAGTTAPSATPTGTSVAASATPTRTPTLASSATVLPTATATRTPTLPANATATPTSTVTPTRTAVPPPPGSEVTVTLQQGLDGYAGCEDTFMHQYEPDQNRCHADALEAGYKQRYATLLRFDLSPVPAGSVVSRATLQLYAQGWGGVDTTLELYRVLRPWQVCEATWNRAQVGVSWGLAGVNDTATDRGSVPESSIKTDTIWKWYSFDITALAQGWFSGSVGNNGVFLRNFPAWSEGKFYFSSARGQTVAFRPKLVITYRVGLPAATPTASATPTRTMVPTVTASPSASPTLASSATVVATATRTPTPTRTAVAPPPGAETTVILQQGLNDYAGCEDTFMHQYEPDRNTCRVAALEVGYKQRYAALLRFDLSPVPGGSTVSQATLQLYAQGWGGVDTTLELYRVLRPWRVCEATWNAAQPGNAWGLAGANDPLTDRAAVPESSVTTKGIWTWYTFDVTVLVQAWLDGSLENNGVFLRGASSRSEGKLYFSSTEVGTASFRPRLVITYR